MKTEKGVYGYRDYFKRNRMIWIGIMALAIGFLMVIRFTTENRTLNILSIISAVLIAIPLANLATPLAAVWKYRTPDRSFLEKMKPYEEKAIVLYDLILTTTTSVLPMDAIVVHPAGIYGYNLNPKADIKSSEQELNRALESMRLDPNMHIISDWKTFEKRLESLKPISQYEDDGSMEYTVETLKKLSM